MKTLIISLIFLPALAFAQPGGGARTGHRGPPPEALEACAEAEAGAECACETRRGEESGVCWAPEGKPLACKPHDAPERPRRR